MALVTNLVWILFVASVQCSYRQWHSSSWNNQNQNTNDSNEDNKQALIISQASLQKNPMWRDLALSQLQAAPSINTWNQADKANDFSSWFSSQISASEKNQPKLQSTTPELQSDTKAWSQISGGIASSIWNNNDNQIEVENHPSGWYINDNLSEKIEPDQNVKHALEFHSNGNKWNPEVAENILAGWYNNGKIKNELQSNKNVNGWNQDGIKNEPSTWNTKHYQSTKPEYSFDFNAWNQAVSSNVPYSSYSNTNTMNGKNINMQSIINPVETNPDMYRKVKSTTTSNVNNWNNFNSDFSTNLELARINKPQIQIPIHSDTSFTNSKLCTDLRHI